MITLEDLRPNAAVRGILPDCLVTVVQVARNDADSVILTYKDPSGRLGDIVLYRHDEAQLTIVEQGRPWKFDGSGALFRLVSEAHRIRLAHLFDPLLAVHASLVEPLPHQITAVYEAMLPRQPLRFLLADDPGAGKTIMAGLLMRELAARGDVQRCLVVCPGSLVEQWQDELNRRFHLPFEILTNDKLEAARTGNWFVENHLVIARLDKLARDEETQAKLAAPDARWDLVVCDEAHKLSATYFGDDIKYTKRYRLGQLLSTLTRHFLLLTATPHNGKDDDFRLLLALLDADRFEGRASNALQPTDAADMMRRMIKEKLLTFDATPLFPERVAYTVPYRLSDGENRLYQEVTDYVRHEFDRAQKLNNDKRAGTVGFALTMLQRRLASSPEAIWQSLRRRRERLEQRLRELERLRRAANIADALSAGLPDMTADEINEFEDAPDPETEAAAEQILDQATAARTVVELRAEIDTLKHLEQLALSVKRSGDDRKWSELAQLLSEIFTQPRLLGGANEKDGGFPLPGGELTDVQPQITEGEFMGSPRRKLVIFTEHRDTLNYLAQRIATLLGGEEAVVAIHGGVRRDDRRYAQEAFRNDPRAQVLLATDAAGEGINLQIAHLMVNYDLPWNPNRIEQRFGRIHRIGQRDVCHLWNLVALNTREGEVYRVLLNKLEEARQSLRGQVFDVLGKMEFEGKPLRDLLIEAIRYGEQPDVQARLSRQVAEAFDRRHLQELLEERALARDVMDASRVAVVREEMERADAKRLQPHYIEAFFLAAFAELGGTARQRETRRYEITRVPAAIIQRSRQIGNRDPVVPRYARIVFEKTLIAPPQQPPAEFVCPGHPLLEAVSSLLLDRHRDLLRQGAVLVDESDAGMQPRLLCYLEHAIQDASLLPSGERRTVSRRMLHVELDASGAAQHLQYAPYLDYRPLRDDEPPAAALLKRPECAWLSGEAEQRATQYAIARVVPEHLNEVRTQRLDLLRKTEAAVQARLSGEIHHWDRLAEQRKAEEKEGKVNARLNSNEARKRADLLSDRLRLRLAELRLEAQLSARPPVVVGGAVIIPNGLLAALREPAAVPPSAPPDRLAIAARARAIVMAAERALGFDPIDRETEKVGYDIESRDPRQPGRLRFLEVKGRAAGAETLTVTANEIRYSLNKPEEYILAIVEFFPDGSHRTHYVRRPFQREPDFNAASVNYHFADLLAQAAPPS